MRLLLSCLALVATTDAHAWQLPHGIGGWQDWGQGAVRGVTIGPVETSLSPGRGYGTAAYERTLDELVDLGASWVSITPFGRLWSLDSTEILLDFEAPAGENREAVGLAVDQAHERGLRVLLVPHIWVETEGWRGEIDPGDERSWQEYIDSYERFLLFWADVAAEHGADMLSIGVECKSWSGRFWPRWSSMIAEVRERTGALLTYSANWDEAIDVAFWPLVDLIGINAFYPLADGVDGSYREGARRVVGEVQGVAATFDMPVLFVEVGYTTRPAAAIRPWEWPDDMVGVRVDEAEQARAYRAVLGEYSGPRWLAGIMIWRVYADPDDVSQEATWGFSPRLKRAEDELREAFAWTWGADPEPMW
ncbi:MAG: hypothetical protein HYY06_32185 [Deltaproteobacteria bacterium]|nr:hypothetical protein [Deltaproteobacteria bacterium]